jgi:predicted DNA-binding transcriptional regulator YafY
VRHDASPTARALLALDLIQSSPGIGAARLADKLGVSERAVRRYVEILREAEVPVESVRGPYGGYRIGRGLRLPPLMFSETEALSLVMAALEGHGSDPAGADPVETALGKIIRVLPEPLAGPAEAVRRVSRRDPAEAATPGPETVAALVQAGAAMRRVRVGYRLGPDREQDMDVDPWAVVVRHRKWYLLCWSHAKDARRVLRVDRVTRVEALAESFVAPVDLDPVQTLEEHLSEGWGHRVEIVVDAPVEVVGRWVPRNRGRLEPAAGGRTLVTASTDDMEWYAEHLAEVRAPFRVLAPPQLADAVRALGERLVAAAGDAGAGVRAADATEPAPAR